MRRTVRGLAVVAALSLLAACAIGSARSGGRVQPTAETPDVRPSWTSCAVEAPENPAGGGTEAPALSRLGSDFVPTAAIVCDARPQRRPDGGEDMLAWESRAENVSDLVTALRMPDAPLTDGACTLELVSVAWFALMDAEGRWVRPRPPLDECGKIRIEVRHAVGALTLTPISSRVISEIESAGAAATGCGQGWSDMVSVETTQSRAVTDPAFANPLTGAQQVRLCAYKVPPGEQGSAKPVGAFDYGVVLDPQRRTSIDKATASAGPARDCADHAGRFALLRSVDGKGGEVYIELDGCRRIMATPMSGPVSFAQADATLIALLDKP